MMKCPNGGKVAYYNEEQAKEARKSLRYRVDRMIERKVYQCPYCKRWHLTSSKY